MKKKNDAQMRALLELKRMVEDLINEDFQSNKKPKFMAMKVTKVEPLEEVEAPDLSSMVKETAEEALPCPDCGTEDCGCEVEEVPAPKSSGDSDAVSKLKKLLGK